MEKKALITGIIGQDRRVVEFLSKQKHVKLAYLFGSVAEGREGKLSDVDLAVFLDESLSKKEIFNLQLKLISELTSILKTDRIDLVIMNDAPLLLKYNIIKHGKILKDDIETKIRVESGILSNYLDMKYYMDRHTNLAIKRIATRGLL
ncbi:MAG: nucleotidyltransferase domain-containing protein [Candidatus Methanoperedens sp.]|nr:nucleotidyltransferase domain-containing protein [Candidatus Methanoperedens sp.]